MNIYYFQTLIGSIVQIIICITSSLFIMQLNKDFDRYELLICSLAFALNALLFTIDAIATFQQTIFSR